MNLHSIRTCCRMLVVCSFLPYGLSVDGASFLLPPFLKSFPTFVVYSFQLTGFWFSLRTRICILKKEAAQFFPFLIILSPQVLSLCRLSRAFP